MRCPRCGANRGQVIRTRAKLSELYVKRRRRCAVCKATWATIERYDTRGDFAPGHRPGEPRFYPAGQVIARAVPDPAAAPAVALPKLEELPAPPELEVRPPDEPQGKTKTEEPQPFRPIPPPRLPRRG